MSEITDTLEPTIRENLAKQRPPLAMIFLAREHIEWIRQHPNIVEMNTITPRATRSLDLRACSMDSAELDGIMLQGANLTGASAQEVSLVQAMLGDANLSHTNFEGATLDGADLFRTQLDGAYFARASLRDASLLDAHGQQVFLPSADLSLATVFNADLPHVVLREALLERTRFDRSALCGGDLRGAVLTNASLRHVDLSEAKCTDCDFSGADLSFTTLEKADLRSAIFSSNTKLRGVTVAGARLHGVRWGGADLSGIDWSAVQHLGDEVWAQEVAPHDKPQAYHEAAQAYSKLSAALRDSGLTHFSVAYHFRAALMEQRASKWEFLIRLLVSSGSASSSGKDALPFSDPKYFVLEEELSPHDRAARLSGRVSRWLSGWSTSPYYLVRWLASYAFGLIAGYGDKPIRAFYTYVLVVLTFAASLYVVGSHTGHVLTTQESLVLSVTSFHGRGFTGTELKLTEPLAAVSAIEAAVGALIELLFVNAFVRRFIGA